LELKTLGIAAISIKLHVHVQMYKGNAIRQLPSGSMYLLIPRSPSTAQWALFSLITLSCSQSASGVYNRKPIGSLHSRRSFCRNPRQSQQYSSKSTSILHQSSDDWELQWTIFDVKAFYLWNWWWWKWKELSQYTVKRIQIVMRVKGMFDPQTRKITFLLFAQQPVLLDKGSIDSKSFPLSFLEASKHGSITGKALDVVEEITSDPKVDFKWFNRRAHMYLSSIDLEEIQTLGEKVLMLFRDKMWSVITAISRQQGTTTPMSGRWMTRWAETRRDTTIYQNGSHWGHWLRSWLGWSWRVRSASRIGFPFTELKWRVIPLRTSSLPAARKQQRESLRTTSTFTTSRTDLVSDREFNEYNYILHPHTKSN